MLMDKTENRNASAVTDRCLAETMQGEGYYLLFERMIYISFPSEQMRDEFSRRNGTKHDVEPLQVIPEGAFPEFYYYCLTCPLCKLDDGFFSRSLVCTDHPTTELIWVERDEDLYKTLYHLFILCRTDHMI